LTPAAAGGSPGTAVTAPPAGAATAAPVTPAAAGGREAHRGSGGGTSRGAGAATQAAAERRAVVFRAGGGAPVPRLELANRALHQSQSRHRLRARYRRGEPDAAAAGGRVGQALGMARLPRLHAGLVPSPDAAPEP